MGITKYSSAPTEVKSIPGRQFSYSDAGYTMLEQLIEDVTGEAYAIVMERLIFAPLRLKRTMFWNNLASKQATSGHNKLGHVVEGQRAHYPNLSGAGIWTTPTELATMTLDIMKAWNGEMGCVLRPDMARMMLTGYGSSRGVGLGVFLSLDSEEPYMFSQGWGVGSQCMLVAYPRLNSSIVVMTNSDPGKHQNEALIGEVIRDIGKMYGWPEL